MTAPTTPIDWFEIPARDLDRAQVFYEAMLATTLRRETVGPSRLAVFAYDDSRGTGGCLIAGPGVAEPSLGGSLVYLAAGASLDAALDRAVAAGGKITTAKVRLPGDMGCFAHVADSEGNRIGLHAPD